MFSKRAELEGLKIHLHSYRGLIDNSLKVHANSLEESNSFLGKSVDRYLEYPSNDSTTCLREQMDVIIRGFPIFV